MAIARLRALGRDANDLGQWVFALHVSLAVTFARRERAHLAVDAVDMLKIPAPE